MYSEHHMFYLKSKHILTILVLKLMRELLTHRGTIKQWVPQIYQRFTVINFFRWSNSYEKPNYRSQKCFFSQKMKENHLKLIQRSMLRPSYYPYRQTWCLNFWTASFKCRPTQTHKRCVIWSSSVVHQFCKLPHWREQIVKYISFIFQFLSICSANGEIKTQFLCPLHHALFKVHYTS